jgi:hypothetical protein
MPLARSAAPAPPSGPPTARATACSRGSACPEAQISSKVSAPRAARGGERILHTGPVRRPQRRAHGLPQRCRRGKEMDPVLYMPLPHRLHTELFQGGGHEKAGPLRPGQRERLGQARTGRRRLTLCTFDAAHGDQHLSQARPRLEPSEERRALRRAARRRRQVPVKIVRLRQVVEQEADPGVAQLAEQGAGLLTLGAHASRIAPVAGDIAQAQQRNPAIFHIPSLLGQREALLAQRASSSIAERCGAARQWGRSTCPVTRASARRSSGPCWARNRSGRSIRNRAPMPGA